MKIKIHPKGYIHVNEIKICPDCGGCGVKEIRDQVGPKDIECDTCQGSGRIKITGVLKASPLNKKSQR